MVIDGEGDRCRSNGRGYLAAASDVVDVVTLIWSAGHDDRDGHGCVKNKSCRSSNNNRASIAVAADIAGVAFGHDRAG